MGRYGKPITAVLTAGERHEQLALPALLDTGAVPRRRGRPRLRPRRVAGGKDYSSPPVRKRLRARGIRPVIPTRKGDRLQPTFDKAAYRERNRVERPIERLKQFCRVATRNENVATNYLAVIHLNMIMLWIPGIAGLT